MDDDYRSRIYRGRPEREWAAKRAAEGKRVLDLYTSQDRAGMAMRDTLNWFRERGIRARPGGSMSIILDNGGEIEFTFLRHLFSPEGSKEVLRRGRFDCFDGYPLIHGISSGSLFVYWLADIALRDGGEYI